MSTGYAPYIAHMGICCFDIERMIDFYSKVFDMKLTDRGVGIMELAEKLRGGMKLPDGVPDSLDVSHVHEAAPSAYPNGAHVAEVEVDPDTGWAEVVKYTMVNDFGTVINPLLVEGQSHGGVVQGIGQAMLEHTVFDPRSGQLLSGSLMDYALPRADDLPMFDVTLVERPTKANPLGVKGSGQAGAIAAPQTIMAAVRDALSSAGLSEIDMPATPERVWQALQAPSSSGSFWTSIGASVSRH